MASNSSTSVTGPTIINLGLPSTMAAGHGIPILPTSSRTIGLSPFAQSGGNVGSQDSVVSRYVELGTSQASSSTGFNMDQVFTYIQQLQEKLMTFQQDAQAHHTAYANHSQSQARGALTAMESRYEQMLTDFKAQLGDQAQAEFQQRWVRLNVQYISISIRTCTRSG